MAGPRSRRIRLLAACVMLFLAVRPPAGSVALASTAAAEIIARTLKDSADAWSRNDLAAFMETYEHAASTTYLNGDGVVHGYDAIRAMYAARFTGGPGSMGQLSVRVIEVRPLGVDYALCTGRFSLAMPQPGRATAHGMFTLVFHRHADGWKIVSDHTSS